ncbi:MAG: DUF3089 domain-containing protein [Lachnospiraceae bacterium]|nr:DUF3089 domain-containing protein [Lachnospiraceae bacterium]
MKQKIISVTMIILLVISLIPINQFNIMAQSAIPSVEDGNVDYSDQDNWAYFGIGENKDADVFLVCPTVDTTDEYNMTITNESLRTRFYNALEMERGIYEDNATLYAPYYRQATMKIYDESVDAEEREQYLSYAYEDVSDAFSYYLENENNNRPIILAGFSQGADMCYRLLEEYFSDESLENRLVAVYAIGWSVTQETVEKYPQIHMAQRENDYGCVVSFDCESEDVDDTIVNPKGSKSLAINPLNWKTDSTPADKSLNKGACFFGSDGKQTGDSIPELCGCYLDEERGALKVTDVTPQQYPRIIDIFPEGSYHIYDYMFFFNNLKENVTDRLNAYMEDCYTSKDFDEEKGNILYASGVTPEMTKTNFWSERTYSDADKVLMSADEINEINKKALSVSDTFMNDLEALDGVYDASALSENLTKEPLPSDDCYVDGELIDKQLYFGRFKTAILETGYVGNRDVDYAICVKGTEIRNWPTKKFVGYSVDDTDDELVLSSLTVNDPFVVKQKAVVDGHVFYWGYSNVVTGWVDSEDLALCQSKTQWLRNWKVINGNKDFIVVIQDKIVLEPSIYAPYSSEVKLKFGTILKMVPKKIIPTNIAERGTWNNYVVYLPTRNEEGMLETKMALISEHCKVSVGFLPMTQKNMIEVSLQCLGNRYGWGGMLDSMDCSAFTRNVYRCFGFELPRNTTWQQRIPGNCIDLSQMSDQEKQEFLEKMPAGTLLYFKGHTMVYLGSVDHIGYVISDLGNVSDSIGELKVISQQSVAITPLTVRRGNGTTWLSNLISAVAFAIPVPDEETPTEVTSFDATTTKVETVTTSNETIPTSTKITKLTAKKKALKVVWKKVNNVDGYKLQYSRNKKFSKAKTITIKKSQRSRVIKGLKSKKIYYVRIRTYIIKKYKNKKVIYYSNWSNISKKKVK